MIPPISSSSSARLAGGAPPAVSPGGRVRAALELLRPGNALTAGADVLAGLAIAHATAPAAVAPRSILLVLAGICLYAGGVALNDVCDARIDRLERPERPIPSGRISRRAGLALSAALLAAGVMSAWAVSPLAGAVAALVAALAVSYDALAKHRAVLGPINMGLCRSGSLLLGVCASAAALQQWWWLGGLPLAYVAAITMVGKGEVDGANRYGWAATALVLLVALILAVLAHGAPDPSGIAFLLLFAAAVLPAFVRAARAPSATAVRRAVKAAVLSIVVLDAAIAAIFAGWPYALGVACLFPVSRALARAFPVA